MPVIKCEKCGVEFEGTEKEASWKKVCVDCYRKSAPKTFKKSGETNGREDCIMRQVALKCLAMKGQLYFMPNGRLDPATKAMADSLLEYMKNG